MGYKYFMTDSNEWILWFLLISMLRERHFVLENISLTSIIISLFHHSTLHIFVNTRNQNGPSNQYKIKNRICFNCIILSIWFVNIVSWTTFRFCFIGTSTTKSIPEKEDKSPPFWLNQLKWNQEKFSQSNMSMTSRE